MRSVIVLLAVLCVCDGVKFGQLCSGNTANSRRTSDSWGQGHYGARRGTREHKGLDIKCNDGSTVYAPFDVTLNGRVTVYNDRNKAAINSGINLRGEGVSCRSVFQAVLRPAGPSLWVGAEGRADRRHDADAERLQRNHFARSRPDVRQERPNAILLILIV
uniref:Uncharacterized protein n=1 Tax=Gasterosteus aculeatus aculeatus TaxID=481459 RepID=G3P7I2_GASAC